MADPAPYLHPASRVQSLDRAVALLHAVAAASPNGATVSALAAACRLNRATAWRLLSALEAHDLVERDPEGNRYRVGFTLARLGTSAGTSALIRVAHRVLERMSRETGETADLAVVRQLGLTTIDEVHSPAVVTAQWLGRPAPLHATSSGKALLAWLPAAEVESMLTEELTRYTPATITDPQQLRAELAETRRRGYGVCAGELEPTLYGVAAPVLDKRARPVAVVSIWGPAQRIDRSRFAELGRIARAGAEEIAAGLAVGGSPPD